MDKIKAHNVNTGTINSNGVYFAGNSFVKTVTVRTSEFDGEGNLIKEVETITEYERPHPQYPPYYPAQPQPYTWTSSAPADALKFNVSD